MSSRRKLGCNADYRGAKDYFAELRFSEPRQRGARELIEGLADLGASCSVIASYLDVHAETVRDWHDHNADLPVLVWDLLIDLGKFIIRAGELRNERRDALANCNCAACNRRRRGKPESTLRDVFKEIAELERNPLTLLDNQGNSSTG